MSGHPVPSRESHRDSRGAKVAPRIEPAKPKRRKFSTIFGSFPQHELSAMSHELRATS